MGDKKRTEHRIRLKTIFSSNNTLGAYLNKHLDTQYINGVVS